MSETAAPPGGGAAGQSPTPTGSTPGSTQPATEAKPAETLLSEAPPADGASPSEQTATEAKPEGEKPAETQPVEYKDFTLPEGMVKDDPALVSFTETASKLGISQEHAQALIDKLGPQIAAAARAPHEAWATMQQQWQQDVKNDSEIGGQHFDGMRATVAKAFDSLVGAHGTPERNALNEALFLTGAGNHPAIVRALYRMSKGLTEGGHVAGRPAAPPKNPAATLYPSANS